MADGMKIKTEKILHFSNPALRTECQPVTVFHKGLHNKIETMAYTLDQHGGGAALAAPQIGILKRIVVINYLGRYFELINPEISDGTGSVVEYEGCLSLPGYVGLVKRYRKVKVGYRNRFGEPVEVDVKNEMARCFQHEIDHLSGTLYIDRMTDGCLINPDTGEKVDVEKIQALTRGA